MLGRKDEAIHLNSLGQQPAAAQVLKTHRMGLPITVPIQQDTGLKKIRALLVHLDSQVALFLLPECLEAGNLPMSPSPPHAPIYVLP